MAELGLWPKQKRPLGVGVFIPRTMGGGSDGHAPSYLEVLEYCQAAHQIGFDSIWFGDHFSWRNEDGSIAPRWDTFTMMAAIAAQVPEILIGTMVACTGYRNSGLTAKCFEAVDEISGGRVIAGIGAGWNKPEYDQFGIPFDHRVGRFEDAIQIIQPLLRTGKADFQGEWEQANNAVNLPKGPRPEGAPILIGSNGPRMMGLLAKYGDAWNSGWIISVDQAEPLIEKLDAACVEHGRDPETMVKTVCTSFNMRGDAALNNPMFTGNVEERAQVMREFRDRGFRHMMTACDYSTVETLQELGQSLPLLDAA